MFSPKSTNISSMTPPSNISMMDRSFGSASSRAMAAAAAKRRSSGFHHSISKRASIGTPGKALPLGKSLQSSQIMESGNNYLVDSYGATLPAFVMEALNHADRNAELSAVLSTSGWAWMVAVRRLLIWKYKLEGSRRSANHQFRELTLPPSDLSHRAQLVSVFSQNEGQIPSCIAVSPEGFVRYWPNITHESSYFEISTELQGQECESLLFLGPSLGCLLATTTSTILQVLPTLGSAGGSNVIVRHLKAPAGIFGGISRRVSSLVFGSLPTQAPEARLVGVIPLQSDLNAHRIIVLSARSLQHWFLSPGQPDKLLYECNVEKFIHEAFVDLFWGRERVGGGQLQVWLVAAQPMPDGNSIMILTAAVNPQVSQQLVYALVTLEVKQSAPPVGITSFCLLKHSEYYQDSAEHLILSQQFILCGNVVYIYTKNSILCISVTPGGESDAGDRIEFSSAGDCILGSGSCQNFPLFFSSNKGILSIINANQLNQSNLCNESIVEETIELSNLSCLDVSASLTDACSRLQAAFLAFSKKSISQAQAIIEDAFPSSESGSSLTRATIQLSCKLLDDIPATDPRWAEIDSMENSQSISTSTVTSLILINQINDKITAHQYFTTFLDQTGLSQRLGIGSIDERQIQASILLSEHNEKLKFASILRSLHSEHQALIDSAIKAVLNDREEHPTGRLSNSDIFYCKITQIDSIIWGLSQAQEEVLSADVSPRDASMTISNVNSILISLLKVAKCFETRIEYVPWTSSEGPRGIRSLLCQQHDTTVQVGLMRAEDFSLRIHLYSQLVDLIDVILSGFQPQISSLAHLNHPKLQTLLEDYQRLRYSLINVLVKGDQYDEAVSLAEKFCDFRTLVEVCDKTNNQERLNQYMTQFSSQGFSSYVFRWYLETGKRGKLLMHGNEDSGKQELTKFLQDYGSLAWLHQINMNEFDSASATLKRLALEETTYLGRKKTLLSLSKLCSLAGNSAVAKDIDPTLIHEEDLVVYQEQLPEPVLNAYSICPETMRVFNHQEIIQLYIDKENKLANQFDFKKALDLLNWIDNEEEVRNLRKLIWVNCILRSSWKDINADDPVEAIKETMFYKTAEMAFSQGCDLSELLVPVDELLEAEGLNEMAEDSSFVFLIKATYEKINEFCI